MDQAGLMELIARMNTEDGHFTRSSETVSWKAYREAETLDDPGLFPLLREIITSNEGKKKEKREARKAAYFIYGRLMEKAFSPQEAVFFLQRLEVETDKYVLASMLDRVTDWGIKKHQLPAEMDFSPILNLTVDDRWLVRHSAIYALSACPGEESRRACAFYLRQEDEKSYKYEIYYANIALQVIGMPEDIPLLERFLKSRRPDLKLTAQGAIQRIRAREAGSTEDHGLIMKPRK